MIIDFSTKKREVQSVFMPLIKQSKIVCLPGPSAAAYLSLMPSHINEFHMYEIQRDVLEKIWEQIKDKNLEGSLVEDDILCHPPKEDTFYDFDFCTTIKSIDLEKLGKYKDCDFMATFCLRGVSREETLLDFIHCMSERALGTFVYPEYNQLETNKSTYLWRNYNSTPPMITIFKKS